MQQQGSNQRLETQAGLHAESDPVSKSPASPRVSIDLGKIEQNTRAIVELFAGRGIEVCGVTKLVCGHPEVAAAMRRGGVSMLADSRLENIRRLRDRLPDTPCMLLRLPSLSSADEVVATVDISLNSEILALEALSDAAERQGLVHDVILMTDLGDLREGVWPDQLLTLALSARRLPGIRIRGLGTNLACFGGVVPSEENMRELARLSQRVEKALGQRLDWLSGINSSGLELTRKGGMHPRINHARIGEAILLGRETTRRKPWPATFQDAFVIHAEVVEIKRKPSLPLGQRSEDAFGGLTRFEDRGDELRVLLNIGRQDVDIDGLTPCEAGAEILGASSDYLVVDVSSIDKTIRLGDVMAFIPNYGALLAAMTSQYVKKHVL